MNNCLCEIVVEIRRIIIRVRKEEKEIFKKRRNKKNRKKMENKKIKLGEKCILILLCV